MRQSPADEDGFATVAAMAVSLAIGLTASALLIRAAGDLKAARSDLERTEAGYALDAVQTLVAEDLIAKDPEARHRRIDWGGISASVRIEDEAGKLRPKAAAGLPESWFTSLGVQSAEPIKAILTKRDPRAPLTLEALADLDSNPLWKACAAGAISEAGGASAMAGTLDPKRLPRTVRLTAEGEGGWVEDRIVRLTADPAAPILVLDRRLYKRRGEPLSCPPVPEATNS